MENKYSSKLLAIGKIPHYLLSQLLDLLPYNNPRLIISPGIGEDVAAIDVKDNDIIVLTSDPITFTTDRIGYYTVMINANDIATSGATPRWLLTTILLPPGSSFERVREIFNSISRSCKDIGISICGGHTEITDAVNRPVIIGQMIGIVENRNLLRKENVDIGDEILLTKEIAIEGTAILANECREKLVNKGVPIDIIDKARAFCIKPGISILEEARISTSIDGVKALHDVTEGGVATALWELSVASRCKFEIYIDRIPVSPITSMFCELLNICPYGLIGSGSLIICCKSSSVNTLIQETEKRGIPVSRIGRVIEKGKSGVVAINKDNKAIEWPIFEVDEITKVVV